MDTTKQKTQNTEKRSKRIGFTRLDTAEIVLPLNSLLIDYQVLYHKLRQYHWNIDGPEFFELHEVFEKEYKEAEKIIDRIAERIRVFGVKPNFTFEQIHSMTRIKQKTAEKGIQMIRDLLEDYMQIHADLLDALDASLNTGDAGTERLLQDLLVHVEKRNWMFSAYLK